MNEPSKGKVTGKNTNKFDFSDPSDDEIANPENQIEVIEATGIASGNTQIKTTVQNTQIIEKGEDPFAESKSDIHSSDTDDNTFKFNPRVLGIPDHPPKGRKVPKAIIPAGITKNVTKLQPAAVKKFHIANGLSCMVEGPNSNEPVERETVKANTYRDRREADVISKEEDSGQSWETIKRSTLLLDGDVIKNPYPSRIYLPRPDLQTWVKDFRIAFFKNSPWNYEQILEDEIAIEEREANAAVKRYIHGKNVDQQFDAEQRRFIWLINRSLITNRTSNNEVERYNNSFFFPETNLERVNPYNNWFLRFPEMCPSFLFMQFQTCDALIDLANRIKKKFSQAKSLFKGSIGRPRTAPGPSKEISSTDTRRILERLVPKIKRPTGYRMYTNSSDFQEVILPNLMAEEMARERERLHDEEKRWSHRDYFQLVERVKADAWRALSLEEKEEWCSKAKSASQPGEEMFDCLSSDERVDLCLKINQIILQDLAEFAGWIQMSYQAFTVCGKVYVSANWNGKSPWDKPWHLENPDLHNKAYEFIRDSAAQTFKISPDKVEVLEFEQDSLDKGIESGGIAQGSENPVLPPFPLTPDSRSTVRSAKMLQKWFITALKIVHKKSNTLNSKLFDRAIMYQSEWFENFPVERKNRTLPLGSFEVMTPAHLSIWIKHLALSFTEGSEYDRKFKFKSANGSDMRITLVRGVKEASEVDELGSDEEGEEAKMGGKKPKGSRASRAVKGKGLLRKKRAGTQKKGKKKEVTSSGEETSSESESEARSDKSLPNKERTASAKKKKQSNANSALAKENRKRPGHQKNTMPRSQDNNDVHPEVKSLFFQLPSMESSSLPRSWMKTTWKPVTVDKELCTIYETLKDQITDRYAEGQLQIDAPLQVLSSNANVTAKRFPGLFDAGAQIDFIQDALRNADEHYSDVHDFPSIPNSFDPPTEEIGEAAMVIIKQLRDLTAQYPVYDSAEPIFQHAAEFICLDLHEWVNNVLKEMEKPEIIDKCRLPSRLSASLMRILLFLSEWDKDFDPALVTRACIVFGVTAMHRYARTVLLEIANSLLVVTANRGIEHRRFIATLQTAAAEWLRYSQSALVNLFEKKNSATAIVANEFGRRFNTTETSLSLLAPTKDLPWWSSSAMDFPVLIRAHGNPPTVDCILELQFDGRWGSFGYADSFMLLCTLLACSSEAINAPEKLDEAHMFTKSLRKREKSILSHVTTFIKCLVGEKENDQTALKISRTLSLPKPSDSMPTATVASSSKSIPDDAFEDEEEDEGKKGSSDVVNENKRKRTEDISSKTPKKAKREIFGIANPMNTGSEEKMAYEVNAGNNEEEEETKLWRSPRKKVPTKRFIQSPPSKKK